MLPNVLVVGAAKCGTTSLHEYLDRHPEIAMAREKELDFFVEQKNWSRGVDWYERQFAAAPVRGESSPSYTAYPRYRGVPERIRRIVPDAKLVYLVRDPVERALDVRRPGHVVRDELDALVGLGLQLLVVAAGVGEDDRSRRA